MDQEALFETPPERVPKKFESLADLPAGFQASVRAVFAVWTEVVGKRSDTRLSPKRLKKIVYALQVYPLEDVQDAVRGVAKSRFHMGDNSSGIKYNDLLVILRDESQIEKFRDLYRTKVPPKTPIREDWEAVPEGIVDHRAVIRGTI